VLVEWFSELESLTLACFQSFCEELKDASKELTERLVPSHVIVACVFHEVNQCNRMKCYNSFVFAPSDLTSYQRAE
jgi:hypothetical protein